MRSLTAGGKEAALLSAADPCECVARWQQGEQAAAGVLYLGALFAAESYQIHVRHRQQLFKCVDLLSRSEEKKKKKIYLQ